MPRPPSRATNHGTNDPKAPAPSALSPSQRPTSPTSPTFPLTPRTNISGTYVKQIKDKLEQPSIPNADRARPKWNLREERKDPFNPKTGQEQVEKVRPLKKRDADKRRRLFLPEVSGEGEEEDKEDESGAHFELHPRLEPLLQGVAEVLLPRGMTAFQFAMEPWLRDNEEYRHYLAPTTPSSTLSRMPSESLDPDLDPDEISVKTNEAFPDIPLESIAMYIRSRDEIEVRAKILHIRTLLLRCSVLWRTGHSLEHQEWKAPSYSTNHNRNAWRDENRMGKDYYKCYSKCGRAAEKAEQMARDLGIDGLQARAWYWWGRADGGRRYWDGAATAFRKAMEFDSAEEKKGKKKEKNKEEKKEKMQGHGLMPLERRDVAWLRDECERRDAKAQRRRQVNEWEIEDESDGHEWDEDAPLDERKGQGQGGGEEEYPAPLKEVMVKVKEKYKMMQFSPFTKEEQAYILGGVELARRMGSERVSG